MLADKLTEYREDEESLRTALLGAQKLGDSVIRESKTKAEIIMRDATIKAEAMVNNAKRQIEREQEGLTRIQKEVASFKNRLLDLYKQHLELISALPGQIEKADAAVQQPRRLPPRLSRKFHPQRRCQNLRFPSLLRRSQSLPLRRLLLGRYLRRPMRSLSHPFSVRMNPRSRISHRMTRRKSSLSSPRSLENSNSAVHLRFHTMTKNLNLSKSRDRARSC